MLAAHREFTRTHQVIADVRKFGGGLDAAQRLAEANIVTNKNLLPSDAPEDWARPGGLRIGTTEVTRLGMGPREMEEIAELAADVLVRGHDAAEVRRRVVDLRSGFQAVRYCFD
jgi:glycine hydroxymethyltransferase